LKPSPNRLYSNHLELKSRFNVKVFDGLGARWRRNDAERVSWVVRTTRSKQSRNDWGCSLSSAAQTRPSGWLRPMECSPNRMSQHRGLLMLLGLVALAWVIAVIAVR
jgi:hypothetical protein